MPDNEYDVVIIGGGPAGASAAIYAARARLSTIVIDKNIKSGALAAASVIANYPGIPEEISGLELLERMRRQAEQFGAVFVQEQVISVDLASEVKAVYTNNMYRAKAVIIATGAHDRKNKVPGEGELLGRGVSYCATCDGAFFKGEEVAVIGFNDHAIEEAIFLTRYASRVKVISPTSRLKAGDELVKQVTASDKVNLITGARLVGVEGKEALSAVRLQQRNGQEELVPASGAFIYLEGNKPSTEFLGGGITVGEGGCLSSNRDQSTEMPGVYAVGDVTCSQLKQAVVSAAEGVIAAISADRYINRTSKTAPSRYY